jgi:hypothetical protein
MFFVMVVVATITIIGITVHYLKYDTGWKDID